MNGTSKELVGVYLNNSEVSALYWGTSLIFKKMTKPTYTANTLAGKFTDGSGEPCWWYNLNGTKTSIPSEYINPTTKEFEIEIANKLTDCSNFFANNVYIVKIYHFPDTSEATNMERMFEYCTGLTSLNLSNFETSKVTNMERMFASCINMNTIDISNFNVSNVTNMEDMFSGCEKLTTLNLGDFDMSNVENCRSMFYNNIALTTITGNISGIGKTGSPNTNMYADCSPLNHDSAMLLINGLVNVSTEHFITFKTNTYNTLSTDEIAIATSKGWTVEHYD